MTRTPAPHAKERSARMSTWTIPAKRKTTMTMRRRRAQSERASSWMRTTRSQKRVSVVAGVTRSAGAHNAKKRRLSLTRKIST